MTCWPVRPPRTWRPAWTPRAWRRGPGALAARVPDALGVAAGRSRGWRTPPPTTGSGRPGVSELTDLGASAVAAGVAAGAAVPTDATAVAPNAAGAPIGTKAGPGEIFDAEPNENRGRGRLGRVRSKAPALRRRGGRRLQPSDLVDRGAVAAAGDHRRRADHRLPDGRVHAVASNAERDQHAAGAGVGLRRQGPYDPEGGRTGEVDHRGCRGRGVAEPEAGDLPEGGVDGHRSCSPTGKPDVTVPSLSSGMTCVEATTGVPGDSAHFQSVCVPGTVQQQRADAGPRSVVDRVHAEPDEGAVRGGRSRSSRRWATSRPTVPSIPTSYTFNQAQAALTGGRPPRRPRTPSPTPTVPSGQVISTSPASGAAGALRLGRDGQRLDGASDDDGPQRHPGHGLPGHQRPAGSRAERLGERPGSPRRRR